jgi:hypothetical protein
MARDTQPYNRRRGTAGGAVLLNRKSMLRREGAVTEVLMPGRETAAAEKLQRW